MPESKPYVILAVKPLSLAINMILWTLTRKSITPACPHRLQPLNIFSLLNTFSDPAGGNMQAGCTQPTGCRPRSGHTLTNVGDFQTDESKVQSNVENNALITTAWSPYLVLSAGTSLSACTAVRQTQSIRIPLANAKRKRQKWKKS